MQEKNITKVSDVKNSLIRTGFILEMEVAEFFKEKGFTVNVNNLFMDLEEYKKREIDIIATKKINKILVHLIIECKQSLEDDWIFICSDAKPSRYYYSVKHLPNLNNLSKIKIFDQLHTFDRKILIAQNYVVFKKNGGKKSDSLQIPECLHKLPKALIYEASQEDAENKNIYFPIAVFSGQIFSANYNKKLIVKEQEIIQYNVNFESDFYSENIGRAPKIITINPEIHDDYARTEEINKIIKTAKTLKSPFQIDFLTRKGLSAYIKIIEDEIGKISTRKWSFHVKK